MIPRTVTATLLLALGAFAAQPLPELRTEATNAGSIFFVRNTGTQPVTAYLIELVNYPGSYYSLWRDEWGMGQIAPGEEKRIQVTNMTVGAVPDYVKLTAALFADGSSAGVPEKIAQMTERRHHVQETLHEIAARLEKAQAASTPKVTLISDLKQWAESLQLTGKPKPTSQPYIDSAAARGVIHDAASYLESHTVDETLAKLH